MGLVKTRRLAAMQKQQRAKAGAKPAKLNIEILKMTRKQQSRSAAGGIELNMSK